MEQIVNCRLFSVQQEGVICSTMQRSRKADCCQTAQTHNITQSGQSPQQIPVIDVADAAGNRSGCSRLRMPHSIAALALLVIIKDRFTATRMRPENAILRFGLQQILVDL